MPDMGKEIHFGSTARCWPKARGLFEKLRTEKLKAEISGQKAAVPLSTRLPSTSCATTRQDGVASKLGTDSDW